MEGLECRIPITGAHRRHVEHLADIRTTAPDAPPTFEHATLEGVRRNANQSSDLSAVHATELRQERDQRAGQQRSDSPHGGEQSVAVDERIIGRDDLEHPLVEHVDVGGEVPVRDSSGHDSLLICLERDITPELIDALAKVKRIEVASVRSDGNFNDAYVKLIKTDNKNGIKAQLEIHKEGSSGPKATKLWVKQGNDLYVKSGERAAYQNGYIVQNIDCTPGSEYIEFNQGRLLELGQEIGGAGDDIMRAQVYETVEQHLKKERALKGKGIKVLCRGKAATGGSVGDRAHPNLARATAYYRRWPTSRPCLLAFRFTAATVLLIDLAIVVTGVFLRKWLFNSRKSSFVHLRTGRPSDRRSVMAFRFTAATVRFIDFAIVVAGGFCRA
jgi:hypothetical protein